MEVTVDDDDKGTGSLYVWCMHDTSLVLAIFKSHFRLCLSLFS
jgi:hypothetical protein